MIPSIENERILLREMMHEDAQDLFEMDADPEVQKYLGNQVVTDIKRIHEMIDYVREQYSKFKIGRWSLIDKKSNECIGWAGLKFIEEPTNGHTQFYDLGYRLKRKHWKKGFGSESANLSLDYGFNTLDLPIIYASAHTENQGSNKILLNCGFKFINTFQYDSDLDNWYELSKETWLAELNN